MSLSAKALDRLMARVLDRASEAILPRVLGLQPLDLTGRFEAIVRAEVGKQLDAGTIAHHINDSIDLAVEKELEGIDVSDMVSDKIDNDRELGRSISRAVEGLNLDDIARERLDEAHIDWDDLAKQVARDELPDLEEIADAQVQLAISHALTGTNTPTPFALDQEIRMQLYAKLDNAAGKVIQAATAEVIQSVNFQLESEVVP